MIGKYNEGGLKMIDVASFIDSILLSWIKRLFSRQNDSWKMLFRKEFEDFGETFVFECQEKYLKVVIEKLKHQPFWVAVIKAWMKYKKTVKNEFVTSVLEEPLWGNDNILIKKKPIFNNILVNRNFKFVNDLLNDQGGFINWCQFKAKAVSRITFLDYINIITAIPQKWKREIKEKHLEKEQFQNSSIISDLLRKQSSNKYIYEKLITNKKNFAKKGPAKMGSNFKRNI